MSISIQCESGEQSTLSHSYWEMCGYINMFSQCPFYFQSIDPDIPRPPDTMSGHDAFIAARKIELMLTTNDSNEMFTNKIIERLHKLSKRTKHLIDYGVPSPLTTAIAEYVKWLYDSKGYKLEL